jgi:hypothetical protein
METLTWRSPRQTARCTGPRLRPTATNYNTMPHRVAYNNYRDENMTKYRPEANPLEDKRISYDTRSVNTLPMVSIRGRSIIKVEMRT